MLEYYYNISPYPAATVEMETFWHLLVSFPAALAVAIESDAQPIERLTFYALAKLLCADARNSPCKISGH